MDIVAGISAAAQALDIAKKLREFDQDFKGAEYKLQIAELYTALAEVKIALADAQSEIQAKQAQIERLEAVTANRMRTIRVQGFNYGIGEDGRPLGKPFCPVCEQTSGMQIQISDGLAGHDLCPKCQGIFDARKTNLPSGFVMPDAIL